MDTVPLFSSTCRVGAGADLQSAGAQGERTQLQHGDTWHPVHAGLSHLNKSILVEVGLRQKDFSSQSANQAEEMLAGSAIAT